MTGYSWKIWRNANRNSGFCSLVRTASVSAVRCFWNSSHVSADKPEAVLCRRPNDVKRAIDGAWLVELRLGFVGEIDRDTKGPLQTLSCRISY